MEPHTETLMHIFPICQYDDTYTDYRFEVLLPDSTREKRLAMLREGESLLLYSPDETKLIGMENNVSISLFEKGINTSIVKKTAHIQFSMDRDEEHFLTHIFDYVKENDLLDAYFSIISIICKAGLKLCYERQKMSALATAVTQYLGNSYKYKENLEQYCSFLTKKINDKLAEDEYIYNTYMHVKSLFLVDQDRENSFVFSLADAGDKLADMIDFPLIYKEN